MQAKLEIATQGDFSNVVVCQMDHGLLTRVAEVRVYDDMGCTVVFTGRKVVSMSTVLGSTGIGSEKLERMREYALVCQIKVEKLLQEPDPRLSTYRTLIGEMQEKVDHALDILRDQGFTPDDEARTSALHLVTDMKELLDREE